MASSLLVCHAEHLARLTASGLQGRCGHGQGRARSGFVIQGALESHRWGARSPACKDAGHGQASDRGGCAGATTRGSSRGLLRGLPCWPTAGST